VDIEVTGRRESANYFQIFNPKTTKTKLKYIQIFSPYTTVKIATQ